MGSARYLVNTQQTLHAIINSILQVMRTKERLVNQAKPAQSWDLKQVYGVQAHTSHHAHVFPNLRHSRLGPNSAAAKSVT